MTKFAASKGTVNNKLFAKERKQIVPDKSSLFWDYFVCT